jgi:4-hydroxybenzoate polyprenyltransferase
MANLVAAISIAVVLHLHWLDIASRALFAFFLNVLVYLNNDYIDVGMDLRSSDKDREKSRYLAAHLGAALWAQIILLALLAVMAAAVDLGLLFPLVAGGGICWWYSAYLKRRPYVDVLAMMIWGFAMPLVGSPLSSALGWALALQLALFSGVFESIQVTRDADEDSEQAGVRTTGVVLGKTRTLALARTIMVAATAYAALVLHPVAAVLSAAALLIPCDANAVERYWTRVKLVYGVTWLFVCAWIFMEERSAGLIGSIERASQLW